MKRIFLSHSSLDGEMANKVCEILEDNNNKCWIAPRDISYGEHWAGEIANGLIDNTRLFVFLLSQNSNKSKQVLKEINLAINYNLPMLIIRIGDVTLNSALLYYLSDLHIYSCSSDNVCQEIADLIIRKEQKAVELNEKRHSIEKINISEELRNKFIELFGESKDMGEHENNPIEKLLYDIISKNLISMMGKNAEVDILDIDSEIDDMSEETEERNLRKYSGEWLDPLKGYSGENGKYFSLTDDDETVTLVYIVNKRINPDTKKWWFEPEFLNYTETQEGNEVVRTYFVDNFASEGNPLVLLSFNNNKEIVLVNTGFLDACDVKISNNPMIMSLTKSQKSFEGNGVYRKFMADDECEIIVIDLEYHIPIKIQRDYNEDKDVAETYMELRAGKKYFAFSLNMRNNTENGEKGLPTASAYMLGYNYYIGQYGLPQNWLMAAKYLMQAENPTASYYLGVIFLKDKQLHNEELAKKYLQESSGLGIEMADKLLDELQ